MKYRFGRLYNEGNEVYINTQTKDVFVYDKDGKYHPHMARLAVEELLKNSWIKKLTGDRYLLIYNDIGFIVNKNRSLTLARWNYLMEHLEGDQYNDIPDL